MPWTRLVAEANEMGGRDNITVVLFRVGGDDDGADRRPGRGRDGGRVARPPSPTPASRPSWRRHPRRPAVAQPAAPQRRAPASAADLQAAAGHPPGARAAGRRAVVGAVAGIRSVYFVGQDDRGLVTLYRGVPYELPFGIDLYEPEYVSSVPARTLSPTQRRRRVLDHELRSREDAADIVRELERGRQ